MKNNMAQGGMRTTSKEMRPTTYRDDGHDNKTLETMITKVTKT
jgi:hypothetical protein